jgi:sn-glycerol 3-phosphate transport system substrate-binding protein
MKRLVLSSAIWLAFAGQAFAATEVHFWHAMGGQLGEIVDKFATDFNASQSDYELKAIYKGNYTETMTSAIAAFRAKEQPHIVQVFEVGTATMMAAEDKGAVYPIYKLMEDAGEPFDQSEYLPAVISYYTTPDNKLLSLPFNSSTPVLWYNKTKLDEIGLDVPTTWNELEAAAAKAKDAGVEAPLCFGWQSWTLDRELLRLAQCRGWHP